MLLLYVVMGVSFERISFVLLLADRGCRKLFVGMFRGVFGRFSSGRRSGRSSGIGDRRRRNGISGARHTGVIRFSGLSGSSRVSGSFNLRVVCFLRRNR